MSEETIFQEKASEEPGSPGRENEKKQNAPVNGIWKILCFILLLLLIAGLFYMRTLHSNGTAGENGIYKPYIEITGDVAQPLRFHADGTDIQTKTEKFSHSENDYTGWRICNLIEEAVPYTEEATVYLQGWDGMMASIPLSQMDENWLVFGSNGWECISEGYPESLAVKEMRRMILVADSPKDVPESVQVTEADGIVRTYSPGSLYLKDTLSSIVWQGESSINGHSVSVWLTESTVSAGDETLRADGNKIIKE